MSETESHQMIEPPGTDPPVRDLEGWYDWERHSYFPYRWMSREARLTLPQSLLQRGQFGTMPVFSPFETRTQVLSVSSPGHATVNLALRAGWHLYDFALGDVGVTCGTDEPTELRLTVTPMFPQDRHPGDGRDLGAALGVFDVHDDQRRHDYVCGIAEEPPCRPLEQPHPARQTSALEFAMMPEAGDGWYNIEGDDDSTFRWMRQEAEIRVPERAAGARFCVVQIFSNFNNVGQELTVLAGDSALARLPLLRKWHPYSIALPHARRAGGLTLTLRLNKLVPAASHPADARDLGVRVGALTFHSDATRHEAESARQQNNVVRQRELLAGATVLSSTPSSLGIDLFGRCNIKPACVYCPWDRMKALEGANTNAPIDDRTLESYGPMFHGAQSLVNCSFGEPLLHPRIEQILELAARERQTIELSTNGQAFTPRTIRALAGAPVFLYVSCDAASQATYSRLRNDRWHEIVAGLLELRDARLRAGGWPRIRMVFIPMAANLADLEDYFKLCRLVDAESLVLRPLLTEEPQANVERGGYRFVCAQEHLGEQALSRLVDDCCLFSNRYGVRVVTQFDFGKSDFGRLNPTAGNAILG